MDFYTLPAGADPPRRLNAVVEIPKFGVNKYEYDPALGVFRLDRALLSAVHYPAEYGFIPRTLAGDGDPLDVLVLTNEPTFTGCVIEVRPLALLVMRDEKGDDEKLLAVPLVDPRFADTRDRDDVSPHLLREIEHFFQVYKDLEGKAVESFGWRDRAFAEQFVERCLAAAGAARGEAR